ncbi:MAG: dUTP diphosphatase [Bacilli bacterium]|jgi:dimeric dUTPase (all-alpha-NTP-PPase superfamily)|nr:dUTP diphosphatase [Bacilli bacterium]
MDYDLTSLVAYQNTLDERILNKHHLSRQKTINERILAFLVELGEFANETRCFKYWSCKEASAKDVILEEYVDGVHFLISLGIDCQIDFVFTIENSENNLTKLLLDVFNKTALLVNDISKDNIEQLFVSYLKIAYSKDISEDEIIKAYLKKNEINHQRQENNY